MAISGFKHGISKDSKTISNGHIVKKNGTLGKTCFFFDLPKLIHAGETRGRTGLRSRHKRGKYSSATRMTHDGSTACLTEKT